MNAAGDERYLVGSLMRGLDVLRCFDREHQTLSLGEVARLLGWRRTEPFRFLHTLEALGYLHRDPVTKRYRLTTKVLEIGFVALANLPLPELAQPYLERLRDRTNGSTHVGILDGHEVVYIGRAASRAILGSTIHIGSRLPAHATAIGKTLLASQPASWLEDWLQHNDLVQYTSTTLADRAAFARELDAIRERGYAISNAEFELGIRSVAAPIVDAAGAAVAAINVSAPLELLTDERLAGVIPAVRDAAAELSLAYGRRPEPAAPNGTA